MMRGMRISLRACVAASVMLAASIAHAGSLADAPATQNSDDELGKLPLVELPAKTNGDTLAIILSGDGGWASIDRQIGETLARQGISVVGLSTLQYFWNRRTPDQAADDLARIIHHYENHWQRTHLLLIGYSWGAELLPFMANRLPEALRAQISGVALLAPGHVTDFEFHAGSWLGSSNRGMPVKPEVEKLHARKTLCIYGSDDEKDSLCPTLDAGSAKIIRLEGGHHFGGDYASLVRLILEAIPADADADISESRAKEKP